MRRLLLLIVLAAGCRGAPPSDHPETDLAAMVDSLTPSVETATGLTFKQKPHSAMRSREQVHRYLANKLEQELPESKASALEQAYRLFGLLGDSTRVRPLLLDLLTEQVVGFYDPDSTTLFAVRGSDPEQLRLVLAHEMVHALQGQYTPLDSLLERQHDNDRQLAAQAILEGQAMLASLRALAPGRDLLNDPTVWETLRSQVASSQASMPQFAAAPLVIRRELVFPYVDGAEFMRWWSTSGHTGLMPYGPRMPRSTEQILHPARYLSGDEPVALHFADSSSAVLLQDDLGELDIRTLEAVAGDTTAQGQTPPIGWGGDLYRLYQTPDGPALVWFTAWDSGAAASRFAAAVGQALAQRTRPGYRSEFVPVDAAGHAGFRWIFAPDHWNGWGQPPGLSQIRP